MKKGEVATSTIVWISIALIVIVLILAGVVTKIVDGQNDVNLQRCKTVEDSDNDGVVDALDPCPCGKPKYDNEVGSDGCNTCPELNKCDD